MSLNPHAFAIYLKLVITSKNKDGRFNECQCEDDDIFFFSWIWVLGDGHYHWLKGLINLLLMEQMEKYLVRTIH
jgi:hypothetical protein